MVVQYPWDGFPLNNQPHIHLIYIVGVLLGVYPLIKGSLEGICHRENGGKTPWDGGGPPI